MLPYNEKRPVRLIKRNGIVATMADTGCKRTGCIFCGFGITQDKQRFVRLAQQEPKLCDYVMRGGVFGENDMWQPTKDGLGYWFILEWLNVHGKLGSGIPNRERYLSEDLMDEF